MASMLSSWDSVLALIVFERAILAVDDVISGLASIFPRQLALSALRDPCSARTGGIAPSTSVRTSAS